LDLQMFSKISAVEIQYSLWLLVFRSSKFK
jgi:hypothetical protein